MPFPPFVFAGLPTRVVFGAGKVTELATEAARLGMKRALVVTGKHHAALGARVARELGGAAHFDGAIMHTPLAVTRAAMDVVTQGAVDGTIAIGGGAAVGLGKAIALRTDLPQIAVPTSYSGSEMTAILGETSEQGKTTVRDAKVQPETVLYDPDLSSSLPAGFAATSGLNAIAHAVESLYARDANPVISLLAEEGIRALARALPRGGDGNAEALYGAWLCGTALGATSLALHHKLCHVLGGSFGLPHAETHAVILPHAMAFNAEAAPEAMARVAHALGAPSAVRGVFDLARAIEAPSSLAALGMKREDLDRAAEIAVENPYWNPAPVTRAGVRALLEDAFEGGGVRAQA